VPDQTVDIKNTSISLEIQKHKPVVNISIPVNPSGGVCFEMVHWLLREVKLSERGNIPYRVILTMLSGKPQEVCGNLLARAFFDVEPMADYFLKIDSDLDPDPGLITRLLYRKVDFIAGAVAIWTESGQKVKACLYEGEHGYYKFVRFNEKPFGTANFVGGGCIMLSKKFMFEWKRNESYHPFYEIILDKNLGTIKYGSDERLCQNAHAMGFETYYDATHIISQHTDINLGATTGNENDEPYRTMTMKGDQANVIGQYDKFIKTKRPKDPE